MAALDSCGSQAAGSIHHRAFLARLGFGRLFAAADVPTATQCVV